MLLGSRTHLNVAAGSGIEPEVFCSKGRRVTNYTTRQLLRTLLQNRLFFNF